MSVGEKKNAYFGYKERSTIKRFYPIRPQFNIFKHFFLGGNKVEI